MRNTRTFAELTREEIDELKTILLFNDTEEFFESIDEISDMDVMRRFGDYSFRTEDFSCNLHPEYAA